MGQKFLVSLSLIDLDLPQHCTESLIGNDISLGYPARLIKNLVGKRLSTMTEFDVAPPATAYLA